MYDADMPAYPIFHECIHLSTIYIHVPHTRSHVYEQAQALKFGPSILLKYLYKISDSHFKEMARCETSRLGAIPCPVSCLPQRMLHGNVKTFDVIFKKMGEESTSRAAELTLEGNSLFISGQKHNFKL